MRETVELACGSNAEGRGGQSENDRGNHLPHARGASPGLSCKTGRIPNGGVDAKPSRSAGGNHDMPRWNSGQFAGLSSRTGGFDSLTGCSRACSSTGRASRSQREGSGFDPRQVHTGSAMLPQASECPVGFGRPATGRGGRLRVGSPLRRRQGSGPAGTEPRAGGMDAEPSAPPGTDCGAVG